MSAFVTSLSELIALTFQSFRPQALLPSIIFMIANAALILPNLRDTFIVRVYYAHDQTSQALSLAILTVLTAYFLALLNHPIIRLFEGYPLLNWPLGLGRWLQKVHRQHYAELKNQRETLERLIEDARVKHKTQTPSSPEYFSLVAKRLSVVTELVLFYPSTSERIIPTRLGNVIAAAEDYPNVLYGIDSVAMWRLLVPTLTEKGYAKFIEREKSVLDFLLNTLVLSTILGIEIFAVGLQNGVAARVLGLQFLAALTTALVLYRLSIDAAIGWASTIKTSFDLYRDDMLRSLRIKRPEGFWEEHSRWQMASKFYRDRFSNLGDKLFDYSKEAFDIQEGSTKTKGS